MDLDNLRNLSEEGKKECEEKLEKEVLQLCDPKQIAEKLMSDLEANAEHRAKLGDREASATFLVWSELRLDYGFEAQKDGPFGNCKGSRSDLTKVLFNMIKKYISDNNVQLKIRDNSMSSKGFYSEVIDAKLTW